MSAKLQLETPTVKLANKSKALLEDHVIDEDGKVYKLVIPTALDEFDLSFALGQHSTNLGMLMQAKPLLYIESIDGVPFAVNAGDSIHGIRVALKQVGRNGLKAVTEAVHSFLMAENGNAQEQVENLKK